MLRHPSLVPLSHQHQHGLALSVLIERGLAAEPPEEKIRELRRQALALADVELGGHFKVEEELVFPAIREALETADLVDDLVQQHREMEALAERIRGCGDGELVELLSRFGAGYVPRLKHCLGIDRVGTRGTGKLRRWRRTDESRSHLGLLGFRPRRTLTSTKSTFPHPATGSVWCEPLTCRSTPTCAGG